MRMPIWLFALTVGRVLSKKNASGEESDEEEDEVVEVASDSSSGAGGKHTPSTGSVDDDFELLDKSLEEDDTVAAAKATGSQPQAKASKSNKRKGKKR